MFRIPVPFFNPDDRMVTKLKELHHQLHIIRSPLVHFTSGLLKQLNETSRLINTLSLYAKETPEWLHHSRDHMKYGISAETYYNLRKAVRHMYPSVMWSTIAFEMRVESSLDMQMNIYNAALAFIGEMPLDPIEFVDDCSELPSYAIVCKSFAEFHECEMRNKAYVDHLKKAVMGLSDKEAIKQQILIAFNATSNCEAQMLILHAGADHLHMVRTHNVFPQLPRWLDNAGDSSIAKDDTLGDEEEIGSLEDLLDCLGDDLSVEEINASIDKLIEEIEHDPGNHVCILYIRDKYISTATAIIAEHLSMPSDEVEKTLRGPAPIMFTCPSAESATKLRDLLDDICLCG